MYYKLIHLRQKFKTIQNIHIIILVLKLIEQDKKVK